MDTSFTYTWKYGSRKITSVISRELAETLADVFVMARLTVDTFPFNKAVGVAPNAPQDVRDAAPAYWEAAPVVALAVEAAGLDRLGKWWMDVDHVLQLRYDAGQKAGRIAQAEAFPSTVAVRTYLVAKAMSPNGRFDPKVDDLSWMCKLALEDRRKPVKQDGRTVLIGKGPYAPQPGCTMRLKLKEAVSYGYRQESYADHMEWVVPVEGEPGDVRVCQANLSRFAEALRTTNGFAGHGSSYGFSLLQQGDHGWVVVIDQRSSIAD